MHGSPERQFDFFKYNIWATTNENGESSGCRLNPIPNPNGFFSKVASKIDIFSKFCKFCKSFGFAKKFVSFFCNCLRCCSNNWGLADCLANKTCFWVSVSSPNRSIQSALPSSCCPTPKNKREKKGKRGIRHSYISMGENQASLSLSVYMLDAVQPENLFCQSKVASYG